MSDDIKVSFHVPTQQYGFVELTGTQGDLARMEELYNRYAESPLTFRGQRADGFEEITTFTDEKVLYHPGLHEYRTLDGRKLMGGSKYAEQFAPPFDRPLILGRTAKKLGVPADLVGASWNLRGALSRDFGHAVHKAMECWFRYGKIGYGVPKHPFLKNMVETFPLKEAAILPEVMVSDVANLMVGQIDGLEIVGEKAAVVHDFKSDAEVKKNLPKHFHQLSYYAHILINKGWSVEKVQVWNFTDTWTMYESPVLALKGAGDNANFETDISGGPSTPNVSGPRTLRARNAGSLSEHADGAGGEPKAGGQ